MQTLASLEKLIHIQLEENRNKNLFYVTPDSRSPVVPTEELIHFFITRYKEIKKSIETLRENQLLLPFIRTVTQKVVRQLFEVNQYLNLCESDMRKLDEIYVLLLDNIESFCQKDKVTPQEMKRMMNEHYLRLKDFLLETNGWLYNVVKDNPRIQSIPCAEYDPRFQMTLMNLNFVDLQEPVLDIGCGRRASFVHYLREKGIEAYGLDRLGELRPFIYPTNWFDFSFSRQRWGTIVSNMAFSNHFWLHHRLDTKESRLYAEKYVEILRSLKVGGCFIYSPGLPFVEKMVEKHGVAFLVRREPLQCTTGSQNPKADSRFYVAKIMRVR